MAEETTPKKPAAKSSTPASKTNKTAAAAPKKTAPKASASKSEPKAAAPKTAAEKKPAAAKAPAAEKAPAAKVSAAGKAAETKAPASSTPASKTKSVAAAPHVARPQVLKVHHLRPAAGSKKAKTRVGRGEGSKGKTAGRGTKGTKARYQVKAGLEGGNLNFIMRTPKLRGFKNPFRVEYQVVNLDRLAELYPKGGDVTISDLVAKGAVRNNEKVKVLGNGDITVKLNVAVDKVSGSAEQKIVAAGGSIK
jgi:large subunit ribosomal protein L15